MKPSKYYSRLWTITEDNLLISLVEEIGPKNWKRVSDEFNEKSGIIRSSKQCRDRWTCVLKTGKRMKFGKRQMIKLFKMFEVYGSRWSAIMKFFPNFSENDIKNCINATVRRNIRRFNKNRKEEEKILTNSLELLNIDELKPLLFSEKTKKQAWFDSLTISKEAFLIVKSLEISGYNDRNYCLSPILDNFSNSFPMYYKSEITDLPCEDLFS